MQGWCSFGGRKVLAERQASHDRSGRREGTGRGKTAVDEGALMVSGE